MSEPCIGVDVGGTCAKLALVLPNGKILCTSSFPTLPERGIRCFIQRLQETVQTLCPSRSRSWPIGFAIAGDVDSQNGILRFSPNLARWRNIPFQALIQKALKCPVLMDNDANMAAWGGYVLELRQKPKNVLVLTLGTGVGGGLILEGELYRGSTGTAGEIGHTSVDPDGRPCACGSRGCLERYIGRLGLILEAKKRLRNRPSPVLSRLLMHSPEGLTPKLLEQAAGKNDPLARNLWKEAGHYLGIALANAINLFNPECILLCGGISQAKNFFLKPAVQEIKRRTFSTTGLRVKIRIAKNPDLGVLGAALFTRHIRH